MRLQDEPREGPPSLFETARALTLTIERNEVSKGARLLTMRADPSAHRSSESVATTLVVVSIER
jgi:hypothetical protein